MTKRLNSYPACEEAWMTTSRRELELESDRIELVLSSHKAPARVTGGVVTPRAVQFHLAPACGTRINKVQALADELALALGVSSVRVFRQGSSVHVEIPRDDARPVRLLSLMPRLASPGADPLPPGTAVLGLCDDGAPLLLRLPSPDVAHVLISGTTGSGKTALCRTIVLSLAATHRRSQMQFVLVDPKRQAFAPFAHLPHLLRPIIGDAATAADALQDMVKLMEARGQGEGETRRQAGWTPRIVVVLDELADLAQVGGKAFGENLTRLAQRGREVGMHVIACTQKPSSRASGSERCKPESMRRAASRTCTALRRSRRRPPASALCAMSGETIDSVTGKPIFSAALAAA